MRFFGARSVARQACRRGAGGDNIVRDVGAHGDSAVAKKSKAKFDPEAFLAKADGGVTISKYGKGQVVFAQGVFLLTICGSRRSQSAEVSGLWILRGH